MVMPTFDVPRFLRAISEEQITVVTTVPAIFWLAISQSNFDPCDVSGVRFATYGGAPISPDLVRQVKESFPNASIGNGFGLSETTSVSTFSPQKYAATHADSAGFPAPVGAIVVPTPGSTFDRDASWPNARAVLADVKVPKYLSVRADVLLRNPGGKVIQPVLRAQTEWGPPLR